MAEGYPSRVRYMDLVEFEDGGFLQEANRLFFHPLGLALEVTYGPNGRHYISGVWDYRDDPEGILFSQSMIDKDKIERVDAERMKHKIARIEMLGHDGPQRPEDAIRA